MTPSSTISRAADSILRGQAAQLTLVIGVLATVAPACGIDTIDWTAVENLHVAIAVESDSTSGMRAILINDDATGPCVVVGSDVGATLDGQALAVDSQGAFDKGLRSSEADSCTPPAFVTVTAPTPQTSSVLEIAGPDRQVIVQVTNLVAIRQFDLAGDDGVVDVGQTAALQWSVATDVFYLSHASLTAFADSGWSAILHFDTADHDLTFSDGRLSFTIPDDAPAEPISLRLGLLQGPAMPIEACAGAEHCTATVGRGATSIDVGVIEVAAP